MSTRPGRLAVNQFMAPDLTLDRLAEVAAGAGAAGVGVLTPALAELGVPLVRATLRQHGLEPTSSCVVLGLVDADPEARRSRLVAATAALRSAADLGVPLVVVAGGPAPEVGLRAARTQVVDGLVELAAEAERIGTQVLLEPLGSSAAHLSCVVGLAQGVEVVRSAPGVGIVLDLWHCWTDGDLLASASNAADLVSIVHVADWPTEPRHLYERVLPGAGIMGLRELLGSLSGAISPRWVELEVPRPDWSAREQELGVHDGLTTVWALLAEAHSDWSRCA
jgi:sugar phosphate isomerase/epimerase